MISTIVSRLVILVFGTLYPAYASYKAVRTKNVKEYVKWMMYWIVFALFTCAETFTDVFLSWFPFYYEIKIILVLWLLSPATKGSSILYRKFVHPMLSRREQEIDDYLAKAKEQGYHTVLNLGTKGVNYATTVIMQTAIKGGGGIVNQLRKSYSLSDLTDDTDARAESRGLQERMDESGDVIDARLVRRRHSPRRSASGSSRVDMYFPEVDIRPGPSLGHVRSTEDVSSGYSSAEPLYVGQPPKLEAREGLIRTASVGGTSRPRTRTTRTSLSTKKTTLPEDSECSEDSESDSETTVIQYIPKMHSKKSLRTIVIHEESESSDNGAEFVDSIGFPAVVQPVVLKEKASVIMVDNVETDTKVETQPVEIAEEIYTLTVIESVKTERQIETEPEQMKQELATAALLAMDNIETECEVEIKVEKELSVEIFEDTIEMEETETKIDESSSDTTKGTLVEDDCHETETITETEQLDNKESMESDVATKLCDDQKASDQTCDGRKDVSDSVDCESVSLCSLAQRGGRYNKHAAPIPPTHAENTEPVVIPSVVEEISEEVVPKLANSQECAVSDTAIKQQELSSKKTENEDLAKSLENVQKSETETKKSDSEIYKVEKAESSTLKTNVTSQNVESESHPIKATLVLKPGVIKSVGSATEESSRTVFVSHSPKLKRKSSSQSKSKHESPISRLISLPKKIFGHKETPHSSNEYLGTEIDLKQKRKSWHDDTRSLTPVSDTMLSKSDTEGSCEQLGLLKDERKATSTTAVDRKHEENKLILRTLSHSPKQYRRRRKDELDHYEESD